MHLKDCNAGSLLLHTPRHDPRKRCRERPLRLNAPRTPVATLVVKSARRKELFPEAICAGRVELYRGTQFASLWGGGTAPAWRGRGVYRALVAYRIQLAVERGYRYLQVDALPDSEPILSRLGFVRLGTTVPYLYER